MNYSVRIIRLDSEFNALRPAWNGLLPSAANANTFMSHDWLFSWWSAYRPHAQLCIVLAERDGTLCGIAPMMLSRGAGAGKLLRHLRFIGDGTSETDHMSFVVQQQDRRAILAVLLQAIDTLPWDVACFSQVPQASENTTDLLAFASARGWLLGSGETPCPRRSLPASNEELMRSLPSRLRTAIRSARRKLETDHALEFGMCAESEDLPSHLESLYRNHGSRWRGKGMEGVFVNERKRAFYAVLSSRLLAAGNLRFYYLKLDGAIIAQQYCFQHGDTVFLLQEGFDFEFAELNVGNVLRAMVFEDLIARGVRHYDFLAGTSRHKRNWSDGESLDLNIRACRPTIAGRAAHHGPRWWARVKQSLRPEVAGADA